MKKKLEVLVLFLAAVFLLVGIVERLEVKNVQAGVASYKIVESPGLYPPIIQYENLLNEMADKGWDFHSWLYRGSTTTPDLIFKKQ